MTVTATLRRMAVDPELAKRLRRVAAKLEATREERDALIVAAILGGGGYREVARLVGLSHPTVMQIVLSQERIVMGENDRIPPVDE